jgi:catechol 2,3-dioxygenase
VEASTTEQTSTAAAIDPALRIAGVKLAVADLARSADFYERALGLPVLSRDDERATLGFDAADPRLELSQIADPVAMPAQSTGLFHVAWLHPSRAALAETVQRIARSGWRFDGASDHGVSEALYLSDPDGLGIEIYADRPREQWERPPGGHGIRMVTLALDLDDLLAQGSQTPDDATSPQTGVGHVHLKVSDVSRATAFYRDALGFELEADLPQAAFLAAGGYHHHVGVNSWQSRGAGSPPDSAPALREVRFGLSGRAALDALERSLAASPSQPLSRRGDDGELSGRGDDGDLHVSDPDGHRLTFSAG